MSDQEWAQHIHRLRQVIYCVPPEQSSNDENGEERQDPPARRSSPLVNSQEEEPTVVVIPSSIPDGEPVIVFAQTGFRRDTNHAQPADDARSSRGRSSNRERPNPSMIISRPPRQTSIPETSTDDARHHRDPFHEVLSSRHRPSHPTYNQWPRNRRVHRDFPTPSLQHATSSGSLSAFNSALASRLGTEDFEDFNAQGGDGSWTRTGNHRMIHRSRVGQRSRSSSLGRAVNAIKRSFGSLRERFWSDSSTCSTPQRPSWEELEPDPIHVINPDAGLVGRPVDFLVDTRRPHAILVTDGSPWTLFGAARASSQAGAP